MTRIAVVLIATMVLGGCAGSWSHANVETPKGSEPVVDVKPTDPSKIQITEDDITNRPYKVLGELEVVVNKTTIFNADPTREMVQEKLREEASALGADAVILVRYGTLGVSPFSWGSLEGRGRAIAYSN